jgi:hypothetical protein
MPLSLWRWAISVSKNCAAGAHNGQSRSLTTGCYLGKGGGSKPPTKTGETALVPVFPLFSSGKTVKAKAR